MIKMPSRLLLILVMVYPLYAVDKSKGIAQPKQWSDQAETDLVNLIADNADARAVYTKVVKRLRRSGVPVSYAWKVFTDPTVLVDERIVERFAKPAERLDYQDYRRIFVNADRINHGVVFYHRHEKLLNEVAEKYGVDPYLILSFVGVETRYGEYDSAYPVFNSLHTIIHTMPGGQSGWKMKWWPGS